MKKRVIFEDEVDQYAQFKIRLRHDGLTQGGFFRYLVSMYVNQDCEILDIVEKMKEEQTSRGKKKRRRTRDLISQGAELSRAYSLTEKEKENLFDLIEKEIGDL